MKTSCNRRFAGPLSVVIFALLIAALLTGCSGRPPEEDTFPSDEEQEAPAETATPEVAPQESAAEEAPVERTIKTRLEKRDPSEYSGVTAPLEYIHVTVKAGMNARLGAKIMTTQHAVDLFKAEQERLPESAEELLSMNYGPLQKLQEGRSYRIDQQTGEVTVVERVPKQR